MLHKTRLCKEEHENEVGKQRGLSWKTATLLVEAFALRKEWSAISPHPVHLYLRARMTRCDTRARTCFGTMWNRYVVTRHTLLGATSRLCSADLLWGHSCDTRQSFQPFCAEDVSALSSLESKPLRENELTVPETPHERELRITQPDTIPTDEATLARARSFPITQRLVAAFLDEGKGQSNASRTLRQNPTSEPTWLPGSLPALRSFNRILENRIKAELQSVGLLTPEDDDALAESMRMDQWHLRNLTTANTATHSHVKRNFVHELQTQSARRQQKRKYDLCEVQYLKKMMETGGKRNRSNFSKILGRMHPHRDLDIGAPLPGKNKSGIANGDVSHTHDRKKKKRKSSSHHDRNKFKANHVDPIGHKDSSHTDGGGDIAPHIADIIQRHGNWATLDVIVDEFVKRGPPLGLDEHETRARISSMLSFSRKPFRFPKHPEKKDTYSVFRWKQNV